MTIDELRVPADFQFRNTDKFAVVELSLAQIVDARLLAAPATSGTWLRPIASRAVEVDTVARVAWEAAVVEFAEFIADTAPEWIEEDVGLPAPDCYMSQDGVLALCAQCRWLALVLPLPDACWRLVADRAC